MKSLTKFRSNVWEKKLCLLSMVFFFIIRAEEGQRNVMTDSPVSEGSSMMSTKNSEATVKNTNERRVNSAENGKNDI